METNRDRGMGLVTEVIDGEVMVHPIDKPEPCPLCGAPMDVWVADVMGSEWVSSPQCYCDIPAPRPVPAPAVQNLPVNLRDVPPDPAPLPALSRGTAPWYAGGDIGGREERLAALCNAAAAARLGTVWASDTDLYKPNADVALSTAALLAVSELGAHVPAAWELARARLIVEARANHGKPTAVSSAYGPVGLVRRLGGADTEAAQMVKALVDMCEVVRL